MLKYLDIGRWVVLFSNNWLNIFATIFFNFYYLPFKVACKLPVFIYGKPRLLGLKGDVKVNGNVRMGMIKLNITKHNPNPSVPFEFINDGGTVEFNGPMQLTNGGRLLVYGGGHLVIGDNCYLSSCQVVCQNNVYLGTNVWLAGGVKVFDTDLHFFYDRNTRMVDSNSRPVIFDDNVAIFTDSYIGKGIHLPHHTIVAARTNLVKQPKDVEPYSIIGGSPVRILKSGVEKLLLDWRGEKALADYFTENPDKVMVEYPLQNLS